MRQVRLFLGLVGALTACGDDGPSGPSECEVGPGVLQAAVNQVITNQPTCSRDDECVYLDTDITCSGYSSASCGHIVHRDAVKRWDAALVCEEISELGVYSDVQCSTQASCADVGRPVCRAGKCVGSES